MFTNFTKLQAKNQHKQTKVPKDPQTPIPKSPTQFLDSLRSPQTMPPKTTDQTRASPKVYSARWPSTRRRTPGSKCRAWPVRCRGGWRFGEVFFFFFVFLFGRVPEFFLGFWVCSWGRFLIFGPTIYKMANCCDNFLGI